MPLDDDTGNRADVLRQHRLDGRKVGTGDRLRVALARNQVIDQRQTRFTTTWSWHHAGEAGLYAPESYPVIELRGP